MNVKHEKVMFHRKANAVAQRLTLGQPVMSLQTNGVKVHFQCPWIST